MYEGTVVRTALMIDALSIDALLSQWFDWKPISGRLGSIRRAVEKKELLVAEVRSRVVGFIHYVMHEDIIDGAPNSFLSAFFLTQSCRRRGVGSLLLENAIADSLARGAVGVETSTIHAAAKKLYERHHFKQAMGDIGEVFLELDVDEYWQSQKRKKSHDTETVREVQDERSWPH